MRRTRVRYIGVIAGMVTGLGACPPPPAPAGVVQQAVLPDGTEVRSIAGPAIAPYLEILDTACRAAAELGSSGSAGGGSSSSAGGGIPGAAGAQDDAAEPASLLRFQIASIRGLPQPLIIAAVASRGGSDTAFSTQLIAALPSRDGTRHYRGLLARPVASLLEGGVAVGELGGRLGVGVAVWNFVWAPSETHVSPHRYRLHRYRWTGSAFTTLPVLTTHGKYSSPGGALAEWKVSYQDITADFPDFNR